MALNKKREFNKIARTIEDLYRKEIKKQKLIDTGSLLRSIKVTIKETSTGLTFTISANDYFK